jgi:hypothetical protein
MGRNYLKGRHGDRANAALAAACYNFAPSCRYSSRHRCAATFAKIAANAVLHERPPSGIAFDCMRLLITPGQGWLQTEESRRTPRAEGIEHTG